MLESWRLILKEGGLDVRLEDVRIYAGERDAFVTCTEVMTSGDNSGRCASNLR